MRIAFVGDIHGRVLHLLSLLLELRRAGHAIDRVIQVGDFGAYRSVESLVHLVCLNANTVRQPQRVLMT